MTPVSVQECEDWGAVYFVPSARQDGHYINSGRLSAAEVGCDVRFCQFRKVVDRLQDGLRIST